MVVARIRAFASGVAAVFIAFSLTITGTLAAAGTVHNVYLWVPDYYGGWVILDQLNYTTTPVSFTQSRISVSPRSCNPNSLTVHDGALYVVCSSGSGGNDQILVYNATTRRYLKTITGLGTDNNNYFTNSQLIAIKFDAHGNLWVSGYNTGTLLRIPSAQLSSATPLVDREVIESPSSPAGIAIDPSDNSFWVVGQYSGGIVLNYPDSVFNQPGTFLGGSALNPSDPPTYCISNNIDGCQPTDGLFDNPEGIAVMSGTIFVSNNGGNAPGASLVALTRADASTLNSTTLGGTAGSPFSCPGGIFALGLPNGTRSIWVNDENYQVANTDCGASSADQGNAEGRVLEFTFGGLTANPSNPKPLEFPHWTQLHTSSPGFGGIFVQAN